MARLSPWGKKVFLTGKAAHPSISILHRFQKTNLVLDHGRSLSESIDGSSLRSASSKLDVTQNKPTAKAITISKAMKAYMEQAKAHDDKMKAEVADFEIGKRHLANIMGEDPDSFTQADVNRAIEYLLPSGLYDKKARPVMKDPHEIFPLKKAAQFGLDGRPYHWMYFTALPNYYSTLFEITWKIEALKEAEDQLRAEKKLEELEDKQFKAATSEWIPLHAFKNKMVENIKEKEYKHFLTLMERLISHPLSGREEEFIMMWRFLLQTEQSKSFAPKIEVEEGGRICATSKGSRKHSNAIVKVYKPGTGNFVVNGEDLTYFPDHMHRETLLQPLTVSGLLGKVDIEADVELGGPTGQAGAIRLGMTRCLTAFVDDEVKEQLRLSGLLTRDPRRKERKKPGQEKARRKFTWKKR